MQALAARFSSSKRQDLLVAVMAKVSEIRPELNIELFLPAMVMKCFVCRGLLRTP